MQTELLSKTDNTVRTIEVMISLTGAETRTVQTWEYLPDTVYITYTKLGEWSWVIASVELAGRRRMRNGALGKLQVREPLTDLADSPALAALVTEHMPQDDVYAPHGGLKPDEQED